MSLNVRRARIGDIPHLALFNIDAWGGIAEVMYENSIPNRTMQEIVEHRFSRSGTTSSFANGWIAEQGGSVMGGLQAFPMDDPADLLARPDYATYIEPFNDLHIAGSFYIEIVAVYPDYRGRGVAHQLFATAHADASAKGFTVMSLHVFAENEQAVRLYDSLGYREAGRHPVVYHPSIRYGGDLLIMTRTL